MMTGATENAERRGTGKYEELLAHCKGMKAVATAVAHPCDDASLGAVVEAARAGIITPILVGPSEKVRRTAKESELDIAPYEIVDVPHSHSAAAGAMEIYPLCLPDALPTRAVYMASRV